MGTLRVGKRVAWALAALAIAAPTAVGMIIQGANPSSAIDGGNDSKAQLNADGFDRTTLGDVLFTQAGTVQFYFLGGESDLVSRFNDGDSSFAKADQGWQGLGASLGAPISVTAGTPRSGLVSFDAGNPAGLSLPGEPAIGILSDSLPVADVPEPDGFGLLGLGLAGLGLERRRRKS